MKKRMYVENENPEEVIDEKIDIVCPKCGEKYWFSVMFREARKIPEDEKQQIRIEKINNLKSKAINTLDNSCPTHAKEFEY